MKVSLWHQFSSNHSASFTVVGKFKTSQDAIRAADVLYNIALQIRSTTPIPMMNRNDDALEPTSTELKIARRFGIEWKYGFDWARWRATWDGHNDFVTAYENIVWFDNPHVFSWHGPQPLDQVMLALGAEQIAINAEDCRFQPVYPDTYALCDITCHVSSSDKAAYLFHLFKTEFDVWHLSVQKDISEDIYEESLVNLPFDWWHILKQEAGNPTLRLFEVEYEELQFRLIGLYLSPDKGWNWALQTTMEFLQKEGCTNIHYVFHSALRTPRSYEED